MKEEKMWAELAKNAQKSEANRKKTMKQASALLEALSSKKSLSKEDMKHIAGGHTGCYQAEKPEKYAE